MEEEMNEKTDAKKHILPPPNVQPSQMSESGTDTENENQTSYQLLRSRRRTQIEQQEKYNAAMLNSSPSNLSTPKTDQDTANNSSDSNEESTFIENDRLSKAESDVDMGTLNETELEENESDTTESKPEREVPIKRKHRRGGYASGGNSGAGKKRKTESTSKEDQSTPPSPVPGEHVNRTIMFLKNLAKNPCTKQIQCDSYFNTIRKIRNNVVTKTRNHIKSEKTKVSKKVLPEPCTCVSKRTGLPTCSLHKKCLKGLYSGWKEECYENYPPNNHNGYNAQLLELFLDVLSDNSYYIGNPLTHFIDDSNEFEQKRLDYFQRTKNSLNRNTCLELWSPREITLFEAAISVYGKQFHDIQQEVKTKTTEEVVEFYYLWKKTSHYKNWKKSYYSVTYNE